MKRPNRAAMLEQLRQNDPADIQPPLPRHKVVALEMLIKAGWLPPADHRARVLAALLETMGADQPSQCRIACRVAGLFLWIDRQQWGDMGGQCPKWPH